MTGPELSVAHLSAARPGESGGHQDEWLWGWDPTPGIVSVWAEADARATVWRRIPQTGVLVRDILLSHELRTPFCRDHHMNEQSIQSRDITLAGVFQDFYVVPDYQREYVWEPEQVEQLLGDIRGEQVTSEHGNAPEYFIGSIVVCPGKSGTLDLIDGQQRMTTVYLTLCAIRDRLLALGEKVPAALDPQISFVSTDAYGEDQFRYRLDLQYADSGDALERIASGKTQVEEASTRSIANIRNAYTTALNFLGTELGDDPGKIRGFYGYLINKVKLIRIQTEDVAKALKIFETINDRGVGLDAMDLLKNLLFMKANQHQFEQLKSMWKQMQDIIYGMGEKPLRFLRYFIFSRYDVELLREDEIYGWLSKHPEVGYSTNPLGFAQELLRAAGAYHNFLLGRDESGARNRYLENLRILGGKAARQHLILLLAGRHLPSALFDRLAKEVEDLFFVYVITREPTRDFERDFTRWTTELAAVRDADALEALIQKRFVPAKAKLSARFDDAFRRLKVNSVQGYRLRYILAKLTQQVELDAFGETETTRWLSPYVENAYEIEHVFPQGAGEAAKAEFGAFVEPDVAQRLGNLALVEKSINASLGNKPYSYKRGVYPKSKHLLTRSIAENQRVGRDGRIDRAVEPFTAFPQWNEESINRRQTELSALARRTWNIHVPRDDVSTAT